MAFHPFEVTTPHIIYALLGGFIVLFGMFSLFLRSRLYVGEAVWAFVFGIVIGPYAANVFNPRAWSGDNEEVTNVITLEFTRIVLAIGVFSIGVELPKAYMAKHWKSLFYLLVPVMTWGWFISAAFIYALIPSLNFLSSLAVAACLTPTDPILAQAVIGGKWADKHVPAHIRHMLAAESGCNDGAAFPFLFIALYLIIDKSTGAAVRDWFLILWLYQVVLGAVIGSMLGYAFRHLMKFCQRHDLIDRHSYVAQYISLAILTIGVTTLLGSDDLLSTFFCGTAFAWDGFFNQQTEESVFSSVIDTLFNVAAFIFVGAWMPFSAFQNAATTLTVWRLVVIAILVLIFRRLPIMMICYKRIPDIKTFREALFCGHFGPIGIGGVFISTLAVEVLHDAHLPESNHQAELLKETIQPIVAFMVLCSIVIHGLSVPSFSLGRRVHSVSRTWSRRDTLGSQGPEWANQARLVTRGEDIVINRDRDQAGSAVDLEAGNSETSSSYLAQKRAAQDKHHHQLHHPDQKPYSEKQVAGEDHDRSESVRSADVGMMADSNLTDETRVHPGGSGKGTRDHSPAPALAASESPRRVDSREQIPPDGDENVMEWIEGNHKVIERRAGPGDDVEVRVVPLDANAPEGHTMTRTFTGKIHELESSIRPGIKRELALLSSKASQAMSAISPAHSLSSVFGGTHSPKHHGKRSGKQRAGSPTQPETRPVVISGEDDGDEGWASDGSVDEAQDEQGSKKPRKGGKTGHASPVSQRKARRSIRRGSSSAGTSPPASPVVVTTNTESPEPHRGRSEGRSRERDNSVTFAQAERRPHTAHGTGSNNRPPRVGEGIPPAKSRPLTADSGARHHRLESIRAMHTSSPPTRESSPSRSIRFLDTESGRGGSISQGTNYLSAGDGGRRTSRSVSPLPPSGERRTAD